MLNSIPKNESCPENYTTVIEPTEDYEFTTFGTIYWGVTLKNGDGDVVDSCSVKTDVTEDGSAEP